MVGRELIERGRHSTPSSTSCGEDAPGCTSRFLAVADCLPILQSLAHGRNLGEEPCYLTREPAPPVGQGTYYPECSDHRFPKEAETTEKRGLRGYDGGKKINGRTRHLLVDTEGLMIGVAVHEVSIADLRWRNALVRGGVGERVDKGAPRIDSLQIVEPPRRRWVRVSADEGQPPWASRCCRGVG
jgi:hypothetical protein